MKILPLVSVVIPTFNRAGYLAHAIDSVLNQTYARVETIVVDDGSTDATMAMLSQYGDRIKVLRQANAGPASARNRGISAAHGDIIAFLDSDDLWMPTKLERQMESLEQAGPEVACSLCNCTVLYANGERTSTFAIADTMPDCAAGKWLNPAEVLLNRFVLFNQAAAIRREVLERVGFFDEPLRFAEDYDLAFRLALEGPWTILRDELVVYHEATPGSLAQKAVSEQVRFREDLIRIRTRMAASIEGRPAMVPLRWLAALELRRAHRELSIARFSKRRLPGAATIGKCLGAVERIRRAIFRRGSRYPRILVQEIG